NAWDKRHRKELRLECFWEDTNLKDKRMFFENFENDRDLKDVPKEELKGKKDLDTWWDSILDFEIKKDIYFPLVTGHS
ncbi:unnamed protein product, partial [marine sediment metagenome]